MQRPVLGELRLLGSGEFGTLVKRRAVLHTERDPNVCFAGDPRCPPPDVTVTPSGGTFSTASKSVTIDWCGHATLSASSRQVVFNGVSVTSSFTYVTSTKTGCTSHATSTGTVTLPAGTSTLTASINDNIAQAGSANAYYTLASPPTGPIVFTAPQNATNHDASLCLADCFDQVIRYSTPSYISLDQERSLTLVYRSSQAVPIATVTLDVRDTASLAVDHLSLKLLDQNGAVVSLLNGPAERFFTNQPGGTLRIAVQFDASGLATGVYPYTAVVTSYYTNATNRSTSVPVRVLILNERSSPYGIGWSVAGLQRAFPASDGGASIADGSGSIQYFSGPCTAAPCSYISPLGDFSVLSRHTWGDGTEWDRRYPNGHVVAYYTSGYAAYSQDRYGNRTSYAYDAAGRLSTVTDPTGNVLSVYSAGTSPVTGGPMFAISDPAGRVSTFTQNTAGNVVDIQDPAGGHPFASASFDITGSRLTQWTDRRGGVWNVAYDCSGHLSQLMAPTVSINGTAGRPTTSFRHVDVQTSGCAQPLPANSVLANSANETVTNARNYTTTYTVDAFQAPTQITDALGRVTSIQRDEHSRVNSATSPTGHVVTYSWDGPRLTQTQDGATGAVVHTEYETTYSRPTHVWGSTVEQWFYYSGAALDSSRDRSVSQPVMKYNTDSRGRIWRVVDAGGHEDTTTFEAAGLQNMNGSIAPGHRVTTLSRDAAGRVAAHTDAEGSIDSVSYDVLNRARATIDAANHRTTFGFDSLFLTSVIDAKGQQYTFSPNALGWIEQEIRPNSAAPISRQYDANGNVTTLTNRRGGVVTYSFDAMDRVLVQNAVSDGQSTGYSYSSWSGGSYQAVANSESSDTLFFDSADRPFKLNTWRPNGSWYSEVSAYNPDGTRASVNVTSNRWAGQKGATFTYGAGQVLHYLDNVAGRTTISRDGENLVTGVTYPNGLSRTNGNTSIHYSTGPGYNVTNVNTALGVHVLSDSLGRISQRTRSIGDSLKLHTYNPDGSLASRFIYKAGPPPTCTNDPDYGWSCSGATPDHWENYSYDAAGTLMNGVIQVDPGNQVRVANGYSYAYDADGNVSSKSGPGLTQSFTWNSLGQLTSVTTNGSTLTFGYDGFGRRVRKGTIGYLHDGDDLFMELDGAGGPVAEYGYLPGVDQPTNVTRGGVTYYFTRDEVSNNVNGLVRASDNAVVAQYGYSPFGQMETGSFDGVGNPLRFASREFDSETGLYYFRARYYDPPVGRFISEDPIGLNGGANLYSYAKNDPVNGSDPTGKLASDSHGICSLELASCGGAVELEGWVRNAGRDGGGRAGPTVSCVSSDVSWCSQMFAQAQTDGLRVGGLGSGVWLGVWEINGGQLAGAGNTALGLVTNSSASYIELAGWGEPMHWKNEIAIRSSPYYGSVGDYRWTLVAGARAIPGVMSAYFVARTEFAGKLYWLADSNRFTSDILYHAGIDLSSEQAAWMGWVPGWGGHR